MNFTGAIEAKNERYDKDAARCWMDCSRDVQILHPNKSIRGAAFNFRRPILASWEEFSPQPSLRVPLDRVVTALRRPANMLSPANSTAVRLAAHSCSPARSRSGRSRTSSTRRPWLPPLLLRRYSDHANNHAAATWTAGAARWRIFWKLFNRKNRAAQSPAIGTFVRAAARERFHPLDAGLFHFPQTFGDIAIHGGTKISQS